MIKVYVTYLYVACTSYFDIGTGDIDLLPTFHACWTCPDGDLASQGFIGNSCRGTTR